MRIPATQVDTGRLQANIGTNQELAVATREAVLLALRSAPFDSAKARRELGYRPGPIDRPLTEVVEAFKREHSNLAVAAKAV